MEQLHQIITSTCDTFTNSQGYRQCLPRINEQTYAYNGFVLSIKRLGKLGWRKVVNNTIVE